MVWIFPQIIAWVSKTFSRSNDGLRYGFFGAAARGDPSFFSCLLMLTNTARF